MVDFAQIDGYNAEQLSAMMKKYKILSPNGNVLSEPEVFNLMFGTPIGPTGVLKGYIFRVLPVPHTLQIPPTRNCSRTVSQLQEAFGIQHGKDAIRFSADRSLVP